MEPLGGAGFRGPGGALLASILVVIAVLSNLQQSAQAFECHSENLYNCSCIHGDDAYVLDCPRLVDQPSPLTVELSPDLTSAEVVCRGNVTASDFRRLDGINITSLKKIQLKSCPLPKVPFVQVFQIRHANETKHLRFIERVLGENLTSQLEGLTNLEDLYISDNFFKTIPVEAFEPVRNLMTLSLRNNLLSTVSKELMDKVPKLTFLELARNRITYLPDGVFSSLVSLKKLLLDSNDLGNSTLSADIFQGLTNLDTLDLQNNNLVSLPEGLFKHLPNLQKLNLNANKFETLPAGIFQSLTKLESLKLSSNKGSKLVLPDDLFANMTSLQQILMDGSGIEVLPESIFSGAVALVNISLNKNRLKELPVNLFHDTINVQNLYLQDNEISELPQKLFYSLENLRYLDLSRNKISNITEELFWKTGHLKELYLQNNKLSFFDARAFQTCDLRKLNMANNHLTFSNTFTDPTFNWSNSPLAKCLKLEELNLENNEVPVIFYDWRDTFTTLRTLNLARNKLNYVNSNSIVGFTSGAEIDLRHNNISVVDLDVAHLLHQDSGRTESERIRFLLDDNPINCDCRNFHHLRFYEGKLEAEIYKRIVLEAGNLNCSRPRNFKGISVKKVPSRLVTCPLDHDVDRAPCPSSCECKTRPEDEALIVQCSGARLTSAPDELPTSPLTSHTELNISNNMITSLPFLTQPGYGKVTKLYASHNRISQLNISSIPSSLEVLELDNNNLTMIQRRVIEYISNMTSLTNMSLHNNSWDCQCGSSYFVEFVRAKYKEIQLVEEVKCADGRLVTKLTESGLCPNISAIIWIVFVGFLCVIICGLVIAYYRYQQEIKVWLFAHRMCLWWVTEQELDRDKRYDAFLCFSNKDQEFVDNELVPNLESGPTPFKLCIHTRDFVPGGWITNQIIEAVQNSRRTIIVLSPSFVDSEWGRMEFRTAHAQAMSEGRARVIVILYGDVGPTENLEPELQAYLNMNTYVKWDDPWFWRKLRYALPHPPELLKSHPAMSFVRQASLRRKPLEDRLELICDPNCPSVLVSPSPEENDCTAINNEKNAKLNETNGVIPSPIKVAAAAS